MFTRIGLPILAGIGLLLGIVAVVISHISPPTPPIPIPPPTPPFDHYISASGTVEASSRDIRIGSAITEVMEELFVQPGDLVEKGAPLFRIHNNGAKARVEQARAALAVSQAQYQRLLDLPRPEDLSILESKLEIQKSFYLNELSKFELIENLDNPRAVSRDEQNQRRYGAMQARFTLREAQEELTKALAGAWIDDLNIAKGEVQEMKEALAIEEAYYNKTTVYAPFTGTVLRINTYPGELVTTEQLDNPTMIFGVIDPLNVRVDIDEEEIWRIEKGAPGVAYVRGMRSAHVPLKFIRIEPYLIAKQNLSGAATELVDTRVLQVLYEFDRDEMPIYPGQILDVFLKAKPSMETP